MPCPGVAMSIPFVSMSARIGCDPAPPDDDDPPTGWVPPAPPGPDDGVLSTTHPTRRAATVAAARVPKLNSADIRVLLAKLPESRPHWICRAPDLRFTDVRSPMAARMAAPAPAPSAVK